MEIMKRALAIMMTVALMITSVPAAFVTEAHAAENTDTRVADASTLVGWKEFFGESEDDFNILCDFIKEIRFDHLGAFTYSPEEGTIGADLPNQIDEDVKISRYEKIMEIQREISFENNKRRINQTSKGLVVGYDEERHAYLLRSGYNAPDDIDGNIYGYCEEELSLGDKVSFVIVDADEYDLYAKIINI